MIVKREADREEVENAAADICAHYCRYPLLWDEQVMGYELTESELCRNCPMSVLLKGCITDEYPLGRNDWQE